MKKDYKKIIIKNFIIDVDGVFTDGKFYYSAEGKIMKRFGPDDSDAISILKHIIHIHTITGDKRGFPITKKRIADDMKLPLDLVSTFDRIAWIKEKFNPGETIYMGDGIYDPLVFKAVAYSIAPANSFYKTKEAADFVTTAKGGEGAVAEACVHIMEKLLGLPFDIHNMDFSKGSGAWNKNEVHKKG